MVGRRVQRLGDDAVRVLCLAAVVGREFDVDLLSALAEIGENRLLDHLDAAVGAAILVESGVAHPEHHAKFVIDPRSTATAPGALRNG